MNMILLCVLAACGQADQKPDEKPKRDDPKLHEITYVAVYYGHLGVDRNHVIVDVRFKHKLTYEQHKTLRVALFEANQKDAPVYSSRDRPALNSGDTRIYLMQIEQMLPFAGGTQVNLIYYLNGRGYVWNQPLEVRVPAGQRVAR
jgi:hypothetical protein